MAQTNPKVPTNPDGDVNVPDENRPNTQPNE